MLKKIFCAAFLMAAIVFVGNPQVSAKDVWLYSNSGTEYYVMTETLTTNYNPNRRGSSGLFFEGYVKYVRNGSLLAKKKFHTSNGEAYFSYSIDNSKEISYPDRGIAESEVAYAFNHYCWEHFNVGDYFRMRD